MHAELTIEETNKLRIKLGLKPIPIPTSNTIIKDDNEVHLDKEEDRGRINDSSVHKKKKKTLEDDLNNAVVTDGEIFTLKDVDILDAVDSDEQNELVAESEVLDSMMNDKRKYKDSKHSMYNVSDGEQEEETQNFKIEDAAIVKLKTSETFKEKQRLKKLESEAVRTGRQLIEIGNDDRDEEENEDKYSLVGASDFLKRKKGKNKDKLFKKNKKGKLVKSNNSGKSLFSEEDLDLSKHVNLEIDDNDNENFDSDELDLQKLTALKNKKKTPKRENNHDLQENKKRIKKNVFTSEMLEGEDKVNDETLVIGGNSEFLNNLKQTIFDERHEQGKNEEKDDTVSKYVPLKIDLKQKKTEEEKETDKKQDDEDNFNNAGIGSMLQYLKKNSLLRITEKSKQESSERELQTRIRDKMGNNDSNEMEEHAKIKILQEQYNPEINITYMDDENNELSRREAYKYMSHKFHGKKLSNKKQAKIFQKRK